MSIPATGTITLSQVISITGAPSGTRLSQFVKGGAHIKDLGTRTANVPTAVPIYMSNLRGVPNKDVNDLPYMTGLIGAYFAEYFSTTTNIWSDVSGSNNHATATGTITVSSTMGPTTGSGSLKIISGGTSSYIIFPTAILPSTYTLFHVTRYSFNPGLGTQRRIFTSTTSNWLSGFHGGNTGVAYHEGWIGPYPSTTRIAGNNVWYRGTNYSVLSGNRPWLISTDQTNLYRANGRTNGTSGANIQNCSPLTINTYSSETSDWDVACVIVYNNVLGPTNYVNVERWLANRYALALENEYIPPHSTGLIGAYFGETYGSDGKWYDMSGQYNHATSSGTVTKVTNGIAGRAYLSGGTSASITFPTAILPSTYTLFHVARYAGTSTARGRIFTSTAINWLSGFHNGNSGVAYHNGWIDNSTYEWSTAYASQDSNPSFTYNTQGLPWLLSTDRNWAYAANGILKGSWGQGGASASPMTINTLDGETSDWHVACVLVFNNNLSDANIKLVEKWLAYKYGLHLNTWQASLQFIAYNGYNESNLAYSSTATPLKRGYTSDGTNINKMTNGWLAVNGASTNFTLEFLGYFLPRTTGTHTFYVNSDDFSYVWVGDIARSGYTTSNAVTSQPGFHTANGATAGTISLTAGVYYPVRIQYGQGTLGYDLQFSFATPNVSQTYNLSGYFIAAGLLYNTFNGNMNDNVAFFNTAIRTSYGFTVNGTNISTITAGTYTGTTEQVSIQLTGYFLPKVTGLHTFFINSDDCSYVWIDDFAVSGYTTSNAVTSQPGAHGTTIATAGYSYLVAGRFYPIRIQFGQGGGYGDLQFSFATPTVSMTYNLHGYFFPMIESVESVSVYYHVYAGFSLGNYEGLYTSSSQYYDYPETISQYSIEDANGMMDRFKTNGERSWGFYDEMFRYSYISSNLNTWPGHTRIYA